MLKITNRIDYGKLTKFFRITTFLLSGSVLALVGAGFFTEQATNFLQPALCAAIASAILSFSVELFEIRNNNDKTDNLIHEIKTSVANLQVGLCDEKNNVDDYLHSRDEINRIVLRNQGNIFSNAKSIEVSGMSLRGMAVSKFDSFQIMLRNGGTCKFAVVSPDGKSPEIIAKIYDASNNAEKYRNEIRNSIHYFQKLKNEFPNQVSIIVTDHIPSTSITIIDRDSDNTECFVEIYTYSITDETDPKLKNMSRPHLYLNSKNSEVWIKYFIAQFDEIIKQGNEYEQS